MILVVLLYLLFSLTFTFGKAAIAYAGAIFFTGSRMFVGGLVLLIYYIVSNRAKAKEFLAFKYMRLWLVLALFNIFLSNTLEFWGLQTLSAAKASFLFSLSPFFAALFSYLFFGERMTHRKWIGLMIGFIGFIPILIHSTPKEDLLNDFSIFSWGEIALIGAAIANALGWIIMRHSIHKKGYPATLSNGMSMLLGSLMIMPTSLIFETWNPLPISNYAKFGFFLVLLVITSNILAYNLYGSLLKKYTATFLSFGGFMTPLFAALTGWLFLGETVSWHFFLSVSTVFCGLFIFYQEELRLSYAAYGHL